MIHKSKDRQPERKAKNKACIDCYYVIAPREAKRPGPQELKMANIKECPG